MTRSHSLVLNRPRCRRVVFDAPVVSNENSDRLDRGRMPSSKPPAPVSCLRNRSSSNSLPASESATTISQQLTSSVDENNVQRIIDIQPPSSNATHTASVPLLGRTPNADTRTGSTSSLSMLDSDAAQAAPNARVKSDDTIRPVTPIASSTSSETIEELSPDRTLAVVKQEVNPAVDFTQPESQNYSTEKTLFPSRSQVLVYHERNFVVDHHMTLNSQTLKTSITLPFKKEVDKPLVV